VGCVLLKVAAPADLGKVGIAKGESLAGTGGFSVCGPGSTGGSEVSIFNVLAF
jgi:hypothetical protein